MLLIGLLNHPYYTFNTGDSFKPTFSLFVGKAMDPYIFQVVYICPHIPSFLAGKTYKANFILISSRHRSNLDWRWITADRCCQNLRCNSCFKLPIKIVNLWWNVSLMTFIMWPWVVNISNSYFLDSIPTCSMTMYCVMSTILSVQWFQLRQEGSTRKFSTTENV